jgi:signal transduction histidine kinase
MASDSPDLQAALAELRQRNEALSQRLPALEAECRHFRSLFDLCPAALLVTDPVGVVGVANRAAGALLRREALALAGRPLADLVAPVDRANLASYLPTRTAAGEPRPVSCQGPEGVRLCALAAAVPGREGGAEMVLWQLVETGPETAAGAAEVTQLAAGLSHEGRNILQRGQAALERLQWRLQDRPEALDLLGRVQRAQDDQARLYETLRDYAAPLPLSRAPHDLAAVWREAWAMLTTALPGRDVHLLEEGGAPAVTCEVDHGRLAQAFGHLFRSAVLAGPDPVHVVLRCREVTLAGGPAVQVAVCDSGPALSPEQRQQLFEPFAGPKARRSGLGLAAARKIIEAHGGHVAAGTSTPGVEILVTLPRRKP